MVPDVEVTMHLIQDVTQLRFACIEETHVSVFRTSLLDTAERAVAARVLHRSNLTSLFSTHSRVRTTGIEVWSDYVDNSECSASVRARAQTVEALVCASLTNTELLCLYDTSWASVADRWRCVAINANIPSATVHIAAGIARAGAGGAIAEPAGRVFPL